MFHEDNEQFFTDNGKYTQMHESLALVITLSHGWLVRWRKWRACDVGEAKEGLEKELWRR